VRQALAAVRPPGGGVELDATVVAVAGVGAPAAAGLALREPVPGVVRSGVGGAGEGEWGADRDCTCHGQAQQMSADAACRGASGPRMHRDLPIEGCLGFSAIDLEWVERRRRYERNPGGYEFRVPVSGSQHVHG
jgi:hypothetical protein